MRVERINAPPSVTPPKNQTVLVAVIFLKLLEPWASCPYTNSTACPVAGMLESEPPYSCG